MNRPKVTAENYAEVYDYYRESRQKPWVNSAVLHLGKMVYSPDIYIDETTRETIAAQVALGKGALFAVNHPTHHDPFIAAASVGQLGVPELRNTMAFAMDSLFKGVTRPLLEYTGSVPVFRTKSHPNASPQTILSATQELMNVAAARLANGQAGILFPQGGIVHAETITNLALRDIKTGIARIALLASDEHSFIVPVGIAHHTHTDRYLLPPRHSVVAIGEPITQYEPTINGVRQQVLDGMQAQLTCAEEIRQQ